MSALDHLDDLFERKPGQIFDASCNGVCSNCGDCCNDIIPLNNADINRIKQYVKKHNIKQIYHGCYVNKLLDVMCPFRDDDNKKCTIYEVRPYICRAFTCHNYNEIFLTDKVLAHKRYYATNPKKRSMRLTFFGDEK